MAGKTRRSRGPGSERLTERDRFWLRHHEACGASGEPAKAYAKRSGLSVHALYQARKRLRAIGALKGAAPRRRPSTPARGKRATAPFTKVASVMPLPAPAPRYRVRLANGASLEWEGTAARAELEALLQVVGRLP